MGTFRVTIEVGDSQGSRFVPVEALVDTGATYTALPAWLLRSLGGVPLERRTFDLASGGRIDLDVGECRVRLDRRERTVPVLFSGEGAPALLGAVTLEIFGLAVDPIRRRLFPVPGLLV
jgi:clan AA aspartic protease